MFHAHSILCRSRLPAFAIHVASHSLFPVGYGHPVVPRIESPFFLIITAVHPAETAYRASGSRVADTNAGSLQYDILSTSSPGAKLIPRLGWSPRRSGYLGQSHFH